MIKREICCICNNTTFRDILDKDIQISQSLNLYDTKETNNLIPYNIIECTKCNSSMIKYLADINIVYGKKSY